MSVKQAELFPSTALPAHRDVVAICDQCHREIVIVRYNPKTKEVYSEYRDNQGRCFSCAFPKKEK